MFAFQSTLFQGDQLLQAIADDAPAAGGSLTRISQTQNRNDPAVMKVQLALLDWRPDALPEHGADGDYGGESAGAVHRFKAEELGVPEGEIINDVGPLTVQRLDAIRAAAEGPAPLPAALVRVVNQYGEPLAGVVVTADDGSAVATDGDGVAAFSLAGAQAATLDQASLLAALGDLLERPAEGFDPGAATVVTPSLAASFVLDPGVQLDVVVVARMTSRRRCWRRSRAARGSKERARAPRSRARSCGWRCSRPAAPARCCCSTRRLPARSRSRRCRRSTSGWRCRRRRCRRG